MPVTESQLSNKMYNRASISNHAGSLDFREVRAKKSVVAFFLGMAIIAAPFLLGRSYAFFILVLVFSLFITLLWRNAPRPWIFLVSIAAATPIPLFRQNVACNLIFA